MKITYNKAAKISKDTSSENLTKFLRALGRSFESIERDGKGSITGWDFKTWEEGGYVILSLFGHREEDR